jgi:AAA+ superfamily predicted ATPase
VSPDDPLIASLRAAVDARPQDVPLRLHLAQLLLDAGATDDAIGQIAAALQREPSSEQARALMARAVGGARPEPRFDWTQAEEQLADVVQPRFVTSGDISDDTGARTADGPGEPVEPPGFEVRASSVRLADVGGMIEVKKRLEAAFLAPMRNPELRAAYGKSLRGGLLLYGPPGCGKTFIARALAGELGARFLSVGLNDVLDMWIGSSERNLHEVFVTALRAAPCVLFLDEIDALGHKRSQLRNSAMRGAVNQLLTELDGVRAEQDGSGVFVLAATNHPWDVDSALRRPGRFDRTVLVSPPDEPARATILEYHLRNRPIAGIDTRALAKRTHGFSGADLAHLCETATERALLDSVASGTVRMIGMDDLIAGLAEIKPSIGAWLATARNVVEFGNADGTYDDLHAYLKRERLL